MRLTSVAHLDLPRDPVLSYAVSPGALGRPLPVSFDQRRHVSSGQRPGSWMAVALRPTKPVSQADLERAWLTVVQRHGTLRTVFSQAQTGAVRLHEIEVAPGSWTVHEASEHQHPWELVRAALDQGCAPFQRPSHRVLLADTGSGAPWVIVGLDHAHADAWSLLVLGRDLLTCLADIGAARRPGAELAPVPSFAEHTAELLAQRPAPERVRRRWAEILGAGGGRMPTFPLPLGEVSTPAREVVEVRDVLDEAQVQRWEHRAREQGVRLFPLAVSVLTDVSQRLAGQALRAVLPVHSRYEERWHDSVGWFITNAVLESSDADPQACAGAVREAVRLGSYPLAPIMEPYGGMPVGPGMFAISWLDNRRLPVSLPSEVRAQHVSAVTRTDGVMIWFVIDRSGLHLRCRYPETPAARESVTTWLDSVCRGLLGSAGGDARPFPAVSGDA
ncbi:MAG: condensation domain-containing protein [Ornithinimicrobium sp.]